MSSIAELIATGEAWATEPIAAAPPRVAAVVAPPTPAQAAVPIAPRVQLGFRDGSSTTLEPGSSQSRALEELAQSLTRRD